MTLYEKYGIKTPEHENFLEKIWRFFNPTMPTSYSELKEETKKEMKIKSSEKKTSDRQEYIESVRKFLRDRGLENTIYYKQGILPPGIEGVEEPWVDPVTAFVGGATAPLKLGAKALPSLLSGATAVATEPVIGTVAEEVGEKYPSLKFPTALITGALLGVTVEAPMQRQIERLVSKVGSLLARRGIKPTEEVTKEVLKEVAGRVKGKVEITEKELEEAVSEAVEGSPALKGEPTTSVEEGVLGPKKEPWQMTREEFEKAAHVYSREHLISGKSEQRGGIFVVPEGQYNPYKDFFGKTETKKIYHLDTNPLIIDSGAGESARQKAYEILLTPEERKKIKKVEGIKNSKKRAEAVAFNEKLLANAARRKGYTSIHFQFLGKPEEILLVDAKFSHRDFVEQALKEGKSVPPEVLKDYPDLAEKYGGQIEEFSTQEPQQLSLINQLYANMRMGIPPSKESLKPIRKAISRLAVKVGIPSTDLPDVTGLGKFFIFPETMKRKYGKIYPEVEEIVNAMFVREKDSNRGLWQVQRLEKHLSKIPREDMDEALQVMARAAYHGDLDVAGYNKLSQAGKRAFTLLRRALDDTKERYIQHAKELLIEKIQARKRLPDEKKKAFIEVVQNIHKIKEIPKDLDAALQQAHLYGSEKYLKTLQEMPEDMVEALRVIKEFQGRKFYIPQTREGTHMVGLKNEKGETVFAMPAKSEYEANELLAKLQEGDYSDVYAWFDRLGAKIPTTLQTGLTENTLVPFKEPIPKLPYEAVHDINLYHTNTLLKKIAEKYPEHEKVIDALTEDLLNKIRSVGWSQHLIKRKNIPGWSYDPEDLRKRIEGYIRGSYQAFAKMKAARRAYPAFSSFVSKKHPPPELTKELHDYLEYTFGSPETVAGAMANAVSKWFLWGRIKTVLTNSTQNFTSGYAAYLHNRIPGRYLLKAIKDIASRNLSLTDKKALVKMLRTGQGGSLVLEEMVGRLERMKNPADLGMIPFQFVETNVNRLPAYLGAFRYYHQVQKLPFDEAVDKAIDVMLEGHYWASRYNRPRIARGGGRVWTALQTFQFHYFKQLLHYLGEKDYKALAWLMLSPMILGGTAAFIGGDLMWKNIKKAYREATGRDLALDIKESGPLMDKAVREGILGLLEEGLKQAGLPIGIGSISESVGVGFAEDPMRNIAFKTLIDRAINVYNAVKRGDYEKALEEMLPGGARDIAKAVRGATEGVTTRTGAPVTTAEGKPVVLTPSEAVSQAMGLVPERLRNIYFSREILTDIQKERAEVLQRLTTEYLQAKTFKEKKKVLEKLKERNRQLMRKYRQERSPLQKYRYALLFIRMEDLLRSIRSKGEAWQRTMGGRKVVPLRKELER